MKEQEAYNEALKRIELCRGRGDCMLDLNGLGLMTIPPEIGELTQLLTLSLSENKLIVLPTEICQLEGLQALTLSENAITSLPSEIGHLSRLMRLDLHNNHLTQLPKEIGELRLLIWLALSGNHLTELPPEVGRLKSLSLLHLGNNRLTKLPPEIGRLPALKELYIHKNRLGMLPPELGDLLSLSRLDIDRNQLTTLPSAIGQLIELTELYLNDNRLSEIPVEIGRLEKLRRLDLYNNLLTTLPCEIGDLSELQRIDVYGNRLTTFPREICKLSKLKRLDLYNNQITRIPSEIGLLKSLLGLDIDSNRLALLPAEIGCLASLEELHLNHNQLTTLPPEIGKLKALRELSVESNQLTNLPHEVCELSALTHLFLHDNPCLELPLEVLGPRGSAVYGETNAKPGSPKDILQYYRVQEEGPRRPLNEVKVLVVGESGVGKTSLIRQLLGREYNLNEDKTHGIQRHHKILRCGRLCEVRLNVWDFGGQDIMHATHQFFLTHRSVYLLVLDSRQNERQSRIDYWLRLIASYGGGSPVIIVCNKSDQQVMQLNWTGLQRDYPQIAGFAKEVSCYNYGGEDRRRGVEELTLRIADIVADKLVDVDKEVLASWLDLKDELEHDERPFMSLQEYHALAEERGIKRPSDRDILLTLMHQLGAMLHFSEHSIFERERQADGAPSQVEELNVLDPRWITDSVYKLLNDAELIRLGGVMDRAAMRRSLSELPNGVLRYPKDKEDFIIAMMRRFEICFPFDDNEDKWLLPDLLHKDEIDTGRWDGALAFRYTYCVLPGSVMGRLMVRLHGHIARRCLWRTGAKFQQGDCEALVRSDPEEAQLDILIRGGGARERRELLAVFRNTLATIHRSFSNQLGAEELVPVPGCSDLFVGYQRLLLLENEGTLTDKVEQRGKLISLDVTEALNGVIDRDARNGELSVVRGSHVRGVQKQSESPLQVATPCANNEGSAITLRWQSWPVLSLVSSIAAGLLALLLFIWENTTARIVIGVVVMVFSLMITHNPKLRFRRQFKWTIAGWMGVNALGVAFGACWQNEQGQAYFNWDGVVGWSFNAAFAVALLTTALLAFHEWKIEEQQLSGG